MSFSVSLENPDLEWAGSSLATVFGQKRNLLRRPFWGMLADILRFNRETLAWLASDGDENVSLGVFLAVRGYSTEFRDWYLLPMAAAIWSSPTEKILDYPLSTFVRFCRNHGLLQIFDRPLWRTVRGGGREYVKRMVAAIPEVRSASPVRAVIPGGRGLIVATDAGRDSFDQVVLACHSDQALRLTQDAALPQQRAMLAAIPYQRNRAILHSDPALLPRNPSLWSAWNYHGTGGGPDHRAVGVSYLINRLQTLPFTAPVIVSLNPPREPDAASVFAEFEYDHPLFDRRSVFAQSALADLQGRNRLWFCGAWSGYGFHEDGLVSAIRVANALGVQAPWQAGDDASGRRLLRAA
jgi:predicted NAD/FAD-binding protein